MRGVSVLILTVIVVIFAIVILNSDLIRSVLGMAIYDERLKVCVLLSLFIFAFGVIALIVNKR